jgi:hypothetical protein
LKENHHLLNEASWAVVSKPGGSPEAYARALRQAEAACRVNPYEDNYQNTLGWACYRVGDFARAVQVLTTRGRNAGPPKVLTDPADLAPLAMAQHKLGQPRARDTLRKLREAMRDPRWAKDPELLGFLREAEALIPDPPP